MVSAEMLLSYPYWKLSFTVHTHAYDKQVCAFISHNNKLIPLFLIGFIKPQSNYTTTEKKLLSIVECLKQFRRMLFGYEINVFSEHENLFYAANLSESQRVMRWRIILEYFGTNIHHISGVDNMVAHTLSRLPSMPSNN